MSESEQMDNNADGRSSDVSNEEQSLQEFESQHSDTSDSESNRSMNIDPTEYLQQILLAGMRRRNENNENSESDDRDNTNDDADFFRTITSLSGGPAAALMSRLMGNDGSSEINALVANIEEKEDPNLVHESMNELSERLLMMNAITGERSIPAKRLATALCSILNDPAFSDDLELQLVACRCLYNFIEVSLDFIVDAVECGAVEALAGKLSEISYIDLTEQALQALEMLSRDSMSHEAIIQNSGLGSFLEYLDFLTIHSQRKCLVIVSRVTNNVNVAKFDKTTPVFERVSQIVQNHMDPSVVEQGWLAISHLVASFRSRPDLLDALFRGKSELLQHMTRVIMHSCNKSKNADVSVTLPQGSTLSLIRSLIILASTSVETSCVLLTECDIGNIILRSLNNFAKTETEFISIETLMSVPKDLLSAFLGLICYLLPIAYSPKESPFLSNTQTESDEKKTINEARKYLCADVIPQEYTKFVNVIWSLLINSYSATMDTELRRKILVLVFRIVSFSPDLDIQGIASICNVLASISNSQAHRIVQEFRDVEMLESGNESEEENQNQEDDAEKDSNVDEDFDETREQSNFDDSDFADAYDHSPDSRKNYGSGASSQKINSFMLLHGALSIAKILITKTSNMLPLLEREGFIKDTQMILRSLECNVQDTPTPPSRTSQFSPSYANKYLDVEFTNETAYQMNVNKLLFDLWKTAGEIKERCALLKNSSGNTSSEHADDLSEISSILSEGPDKYSMSDWLNIWKKLSTLISSKELSSFELTSSKIFESLGKILSKETDGDHSTVYLAFMNVFFDRDNGKIEELVERLQETLTRAESFEIVSSSVGSTRDMSSDFGYAQTVIMAKQVKLSLSPADGTLGDGYLPSIGQEMILSVHAIATFKSIDAFLRQKLQFWDTHESAATQDVKETKDTPTFEFSINGEVVPNEITIYGAIYRSLQTRPDENVDSSKIWSNLHSVTYKKVSEPSAKEFKITSLDNYSESDLDIYNPVTRNALKLLKSLHEMNSLVDNSTGNTCAISESKFRNWKLTVKLNRQLEEPLIVASGTLPGWSILSTREFPFIFPLETRLHFLQSTSFGYSRLIHQWQMRTNDSEEDHDQNSLSNTFNQRPQLGRPTRHKVRLSREMIFQSAIKVLNLYASTPGILEIEYYGEVGTGLGPTLEFFAIVSREFAKKKLKLWRDSERQLQNDESYVVYESGLFPLPADDRRTISENGKRIIQFFSSLGKFIARALIDSRIIDFNFNPVFLQLVQLLNEDDALELGSKKVKRLINMTNLRLVDSRLADSLEHLLLYVKQYSSVKDSDRNSIIVDGATIKDLALYFELPGYPEYELIPNGSNIQIDASNLELYINKVMEATLFTGIIHQTRAFMDGFSKVFPISSLILFSPQELVEMFGNSNEDWSQETLSNAIQANHGFTKESEAINLLIGILVNLTTEEKRKFLQFLTGSPKLPIGGFKALRPELTVVRKNPEDGLSADDYLPSVMTCANYLKLPNYSSEAVMKSRLLQAIRDGADAFLLS